MTELSYLPRRTDLEGSMRKDKPTPQNASRLLLRLKACKGQRRMASGVRESALGSVESGRACIGRRVALRADSGGWRRQGHA